MKTSLMLKIFLVLPLILFLDYLLMVLIGCATCLIGFGPDFYCGSYCIFGKLLLGLSILFFGYIIYPDIAEKFKSTNDVSSTEK